MDRLEFTSPVGRLVGGSPFEPQTKDHKGEPLVIRRGPNAGQATKRFFMALAIAKTDPGLAEFQQKIVQAGQAAFPTYFDPSGNCVHPDFAWKFKDGDSTVPDRKGKRPCDKEGYPGHIVFGFSGSHPPKCHGQDPTEILTDPNSIKRGHYIRILGSVVGNGEAGNPGVYLNYSCVQFVAFGPTISSGPDGVSAFKAAPVATLPPGASATPVAPTAAPAANPALPIPAPGNFVPAMAQAAPPAPPAPPAGDVTINGVPYTVEALKAAGYTDDQIAQARNT